MMFAISRFNVAFLSSYLWVSILLCLALLIASYYYYRRTTPPLPRWLKVLLIILRSIAFIALFLALTQPVLSYQNVFQKKKSVGVLIDRSNSMSFPLSVSSDKSRKEIAGELLRNPVLSSFLDKLDVSYFSFAESLDVTKNGVTLSGNKTDFGKAIMMLKKQTSLKPLDYVMLLSDGRATAGENLADVSPKLGVPLFTIAIGDSVKVNDLALEDVQYNNVMYAGRKTELQAVISQQGVISGKKTITLREGKRVLAQSTLTPPGDGKKIEQSLTFTPSKPGKKILTVEVAGGDSDMNGKNNRKAFAVRVLKSKLNVLVYSSSVNQEYAFLHRYLKRRDDYDVTTVIDVPNGDRFGSRFPNTQEKLNSFDIVILIDPNLNNLKSQYDKFVSYLRDRGGAILLLMGEQYARSVSRSRIESLSPLAVSNRDITYGQFHITPDSRMLFHPAVKLGKNREEIVSVWQNQPPFVTIVPVDSLRSGCVALGYVQGGSSRPSQSAMAFRQMRAGKFMAVSVSPFWHWAFFPVGVGGDASVYEQFLSATIRWLTIGDESDRVSFKPIAEVFESGEEVIFEGFARDEGFRPVIGASGDIIILSESGDTTTAKILPKADKAGAYRADMGILPPGEYSYQGELSIDSVRLSRFDGKFAVEQINRESALSGVDWSNLKAASEVTGGVFAPYTNIEPIINAIDARSTTVSEHHEIHLRNNVILLVIILVSLSLEWFIRKNRQLL